MADVTAGDVALHNDVAQHFAIVLSVVGEDCEALFLTSNPEWGVARRATKEEIALTGFAPSRATYLSHVYRPRFDFTPLGPKFPGHRLETLREEFKQLRLSSHLVASE